MTFNRDIEALKTELKQLIISVANLQDITPNQITDSQPLFKDGLGLDSIDLLELAVHLEKKYGLKIQNNEEGKLALSSASHLAEAIQNHLEKAGPNERISN